MANTSTKGRIVMAIGLLLLFHSAFSALQHMKYLRLSEKHGEPLPMDIVIECIVSVVICAWGVVSVSGKLHPIRITTSMAKKTFDVIDSRPSFMTFQHRGRQIYNTKNND